MLKILMLMTVLCSAACQGLSISAPPTVTQTPPPSPTPPPDGWVTHDGTSVSLKIKIPEGWETYPTEVGIVLTEKMGKPETGGVLEGILVHIFVPPTDKFDLPTTPDINVAWAILNQVVNNPDYVGDALVSAPMAFDWDHHKSAYYLLNNRDGTLTLLLAMTLPGGHQVVVCHISMPEEYAYRLRPLLPEILSSLTIDGVWINGEALRNLPDPLVFPVDNDTAR
jgi:hypothetical protein